MNRTKTDYSRVTLYMKGGLWAFVRKLASDLKVREANVMKAMLVDWYDENAGNYEQAKEKVDKLISL